LSSILKALKKIEEESPPPQPYPSLPHASDAKKTVNSRLKNRLFVRRLIAASVILLVIITAAVIVFSQRQTTTANKVPPESAEKKKETAGSPSDESGVFKAKINSPSTKPAAIQKRPIRQAGKQAKPIAPDRNVKKFQADARSITPRANIARQNAKVNPAVRKPQPRTLAKRQKTPPQKPPIQRASVSKKTIAGKSTASNKPASGVQKATTAVTYARIDDPKLKLQALAWFEDAAKRMVVINGRIIREGESVEGYHVTQIRQDDVVVNDGSKSWSLEFRLKP
jgi:cytoskeletal protein RodZ